jgi:hypothetical protein
VSTAEQLRDPRGRIRGWGAGIGLRSGGPSRLWASMRASVARIPRAGRACFAIAFVNAAIWGVVVPPFQVPDEIAHFAYTQYLAETGSPPPQGPKAQYSDQEMLALGNIGFFNVIGRPSMRGLLTSAEDRVLRAALASHPSPVGQGGSTSTTNQPPLYYALEAIPYWLSPSSDILTRLAFMRLLSALLAAGTVLAVFMFLRELFPGLPWTSTVGALAVAFQPTFDFLAAGVHGDNLLFFASSLMFLMLVRTYKRGLTTRRGVAIGALAAIGALSKLTFIALLPGVALALALLTWRALPAGRRTALTAAGAALAVAVVPMALYALLNVAVWHRGGPIAGGIASASNSTVTGGGIVTLNQTLDYTWELFLPRLWFMHHAFFPQYPGWQLWLDGSIGHFGWLDYTFPQWVYNDGRDVLYGLAALALVGLVRLRARILSVAPLFLCFAVMSLGLLGAIGYTGIRYRMDTGYPFEQARYLFPLVPLYALFIVLVARGAGRRWGPALGAALVVLAMAHGLFAETLTISRYYG